MGCLAVWQYTGYAAANHSQPFEKILFTPGWAPAAGNLTYVAEGGTPAQFHADAGFLLDPLSAIWLLFVTGVGMLIHIYSIGYMAHEGGYYRFFGYLNLFMFSMLTLILGNNYALMFVGWEGVGLCSYLLIGFYFQRHSASTAANKAFITNRVGDAGFLLGMFTIAWYFGTVQFTQVNQLARSGNFLIGDQWITAAMPAPVHRSLRQVGAVPPARVAARRHGRPHAGLRPDPRRNHGHRGRVHGGALECAVRAGAEAMKTVAIVGALTAIFAATIGLVQNDIKRVLAYSTVSQLGYMFLALGVGAFAAGVFHVFTHAFFKALLFLGSGSVIHAMSGEQDMRTWAGCVTRIKTTFGTMLVATLAIAGIRRLGRLLLQRRNPVGDLVARGWRLSLLWYIAFFTALLTSFYMFRLMYLTFWGKPRMSPRGRAPHPRVAQVDDRSAGDSCDLRRRSRWLGMPHSLGGFNRFEKFLEPVFAQEAVVLEEGGEPARSRPARSKSSTPIRSSTS